MKSRMKKTRNFKIIASLPVMALALISCGNLNNREQAIVRRVKVIPVQEATATTTRDFPGRVIGARETDLAFRVAGPIARVLVEEGSVVRKGQVIAEIDPRDYQVQLDIAQAQFNQVTAETNRVQELFSSQSVTKVEHEKAIAGKALVSAQLAHARNQLNDTRLIAPFNGVIQNINFSAGELINTGMPFASLVETGSLEVEMDVPVSIFLNRDDIKTFHSINPFKSSDTIALALDTYQKTADNHQLHRLTLAVEPGTEIALAPGMIVNVTITLQNERNGSFQIPLKAIFKRDDQTMVWVFNPATSTVSGRAVELGQVDGSGLIRVISGLAINEQVVIAGVKTLVEGEKVEPIAPASATNVGGLL